MNIHAELGEPRDEYERQQMLLCDRDPANTKLAAIVLKHLKARRQQLAN